MPRSPALCGGLALLCYLGAASAPAVRLAGAILTDVPNGVDGFTTYELRVRLGGDAANIYAMYGTPESPMSFPPVYGLKPRALAGGPGLHSWLTIGQDTAESALTGAGINWAAWTNTTGFTSTNALIFVVPDAGPSAGIDEEVLLGTITVATGSWGAVTLGLQGRSTGGLAAEDWRLDGVAFSFGGAALRVTSSLTMAASGAGSAVPPELTDESSSERAAFAREFQAALAARLELAQQQQHSDTALVIATDRVAVEHISLESEGQFSAAAVRFYVDTTAETVDAMSRALLALSSAAGGGAESSSLTIGGYNADLSTLSHPVVQPAPYAFADAPAPAPPNAAVTCSDVSCPEGQQLIADSEATEQGATPEATCCEAPSSSPPVQPPPGAAAMCSDVSCPEGRELIADSEATEQGATPEATCCEAVIAAPSSSPPAPPPPPVVSPPAPACVKSECSTARQAEYVHCTAAIAVALTVVLV